MPRLDYDKLLQSVSIDEVAKRLGMELRRETGTRSKTLCPFHDDKTPSLLIDSSRDQGRQHFYCFACGAHGDVIDLVKERLNLGFKEAVDWLSPGSVSLGRRPPLRAINRDTPTPPEDRSGLELGYRMFQHGASKAALDAWLSERHLDAVTLRRAGFVHASSNILSKSLDAESDVSDWREKAGLLEDAHLVRKLFPGVAATLHLPWNTFNSATNRYSDFFIGDRVVFPLYDEKKRLVGLGGRSIGDSAVSVSPKYQFTRGFPKATVLYRADHAFAQVRGEAKQSTKDVSIYLCEGFLDALRIEALGIPAVAVMGSSISDHQVELLKGLSESLPAKTTTLTVVVCFDRDEAGLRGAAHACLKLLRAAVECKFAWPTAAQLSAVGRQPAHAKDPDDYLADLPNDDAIRLLTGAIRAPAVAVLAYAFGVTAEDTLNNVAWQSAPRSRRLRASTRAFSELKKVVGKGTDALVRSAIDENGDEPELLAVREWVDLLDEAGLEAHRSLSEEFLNDADARLNHARILAYMGSRRGELPCDEPRWERLDIAATVFNSLLLDRLGSNQTGPIGSYDAVWVPRTFGGQDHRLKMMPRPEDLIIEQYLLNEILTERWDHSALSDLTFSRMIPAVRYYREERRTVTTGFDSKGNGSWGELSDRTLSFAYQVDMDVLEGRQPASDQGMYRPFSDCWRDFMKSLSKQAADIGYVYSIRLDAKRYYDRLRRYVVRDRLLSRLESAVGSVPDAAPGFAELLGFHDSKRSAADKAATVLDRIDEHLFGVSYINPDTGLDEDSDALIGIPQGPVLSAWIGSVALFPVDEEANRFMDRYNTDRERVGYARYVDDIVLLADSPSLLMEMREAIDRRARKLELALIAKAEEIPPMSAEEFSASINQGRALAASGPAWEPPLVGDGESGWDFWSVAPTTDRQSALQLLHNVELYKASPTTLLQTVKTAFQAPDLRTSELSKAARLIWYSIACGQVASAEPEGLAAVWATYLHTWNECMQGSSWRLQPEKHVWESPTLFALEGLEHLLDTKARDFAELTADENALRRDRIVWLANLVLSAGVDSRAFESSPSPEHQRNARFKLVRWKAIRVARQVRDPIAHPPAERSALVRHWHPFEWMHEAVSLLSDAKAGDEDPLQPFVVRAGDQTRQGNMTGVAGALFKALLPEDSELANASTGDVTPQTTRTVAGIALQTLVSTVPRSQLLTCLNRRPRLIWRTSEAIGRLILPPLPGVKITRLFSCLGENSNDSGFVEAHAIEAIEIGRGSDALPSPTFFGADDTSQIHRLPTPWIEQSVEGADDALLRLDADLAAEDYLHIRERVQTTSQDLSAHVLKQAAALYRAIARVVLAYAQDNEDKELVPAWPYIAASTNGLIHYLIGDGVSRSELGSRAFVRDGGRSLRTVEVPIFEASLWRVGVAISDYLGLHDDVAKFRDAEIDVVLDAAALASPARYVLRAQLRKLRGAYADSQISRRQSSESALPASVERSLRLLETFPEASPGSVDQVIHVLATESESAGMYLAFRERWDRPDIASFLKALTGRVLMRLPLSMGKDLAVNAEDDLGLRRDLSGVLCFARRIFSVEIDSPAVQNPAWRALCAGTIITGISVAIDGLVASLRSHGAFERYDTFDFPSDWDIPIAATQPAAEDASAAGSSSQAGRGFTRGTVVDQLRRLVQHLGHRMNRQDGPVDRLSDELVDQLRQVSRTVASIELQVNESDSLLEWPFAILSNLTLDLLSLELLESVATAVRRIDKELGLEVVLVIEQTYGYNAQTRRFTDSRNGVCEVTPWMISQFPRRAKHVEEVSHEGRFLRIWSEVFDRQTDRLLSVSTLGEPFASVAVTKPMLYPPALSVSQVATPAEGALGTGGPSDGSALPHAVDQSPAGKDSSADSGTLPDGVNSHHVCDVPSVPAPAQSGTAPTVSEGGLEGSARRTGSAAEGSRSANAFRKKQRDHWMRRGGPSKQGGHVRVALLQADLGITYKHAIVEACPSSWPFGAALKSLVAQNLKSHPTYGPLRLATERPESSHLWNGGPGNDDSLASWSEHRRQRILKRVIDSCEAFEVDLLVLPEYSVRRETVEFLKSYIANKRVAVLAGTYKDFRPEPAADYLSARLTLLWPLPKNVSALLAGASQRTGSTSAAGDDSLRRGEVFEFSRSKKYRSIALEEFFRPPVGVLRPLFEPSALGKAIADATKQAPSFEVISHLLSQTRLPLKHLLELICSEIFLVSSPANYSHMYEDYRTMRRRFGLDAEPDEVFSDLKELSDLLSITGNGIASRRSILAVPAATSRSADYWIAGQAGFLAAGTTSVFCNGVGSKELIGGSCFIGRGSWKSATGAVGYIPTITPYHGWSKGIYYNSQNDALSDRDQAVVVADIDPHNMLEGKPRAQTMPSPLQLVAYLPLIEAANWSTTELNLLRTLSLPVLAHGTASSERVKSRPQDEEAFWKVVRDAEDNPSEKHLGELWGKFSDAESLIARANSCRDNCDMQPTAPVGAQGMFATPAHYDWIDVSLTLTEQQELPRIAVPPWRRH